MAEINENIKPWRRSISEAEWDAMWKKAIVYATPANTLANNVAEEGETDWMGVAISLYVSHHGRRCVTCWKDVADEDIYLVTRDGVTYLFHSVCKPS